MAADPESRATARVGRVLKEKWRLDGLLGVGGMAAVYSATHRNHKRVAIKMLLPELAGIAEVRDRFVREGYAANQIQHPGALSVLDDDADEDGLPFLVMELLEGETVEALWRRENGHVELPHVLAIAGAVLDVLVAAHVKGVVHRDIKPENLFLLSTGGLKVLDFGIARVLEGAPVRTATQVGAIMGTPAFMAPEQALARWDEVDGRTDLWAVAATMFTLLSGQHVHEATNGNEQLVKSATQPARSIASCTTGLPRSVVALIDRALKFDRAARWPDAAAMLEATKGAYEALTGVPLVIEPPGSAGIASLRSASSGVASSGTRANAPPVPSARGRASGEHGVQPTLPTASSPVAPSRASSGGIQVSRTASSPSIIAQRPRPPGPPPPPPQRTLGGGARPATATMPSSTGNPGDALAGPRRTSSGSFPGPARIGSSPGMSAVRSGGNSPIGDPTIIDMGSMRAPALAPVAMAALSMDAYLAGRTAERDAAAAEVARYQPVVADIQARLTAVKRRVVQAQEQIAVTRKARAAEEEAFQKQRNARLEGVGEARRDFRRAMSMVAEIALEDRAHFPLTVGADERAAVKKTATIAEARRREDALHVAALSSFDPVALKRGIAISSALAVLFLLLFFSPIIIRSCSPDTGTMAPPPSASP
jgi:serine/threonine-protein kinase